jgi:hypothetical protein
MKQFGNIIMIGFFLSLWVATAWGSVQYIGDKVFIIDLTGDKWDVTQAKTLGFKPEKFQYGIGKTAFTPLDDSHIKQQPDVPGKNPRIIGLKNEFETHAYSVDRLRYHEIANLHFASKPITAAY